MVNTLNSVKIHSNLKKCTTARQEENDWGGDGILWRVLVKDEKEETSEN